MFVVATEMLGHGMFHGDSCKLYHKCHVPTKTCYLIFKKLLNNKLFSSVFTYFFGNYLESKKILHSCAVAHWASQVVLVVKNPPAIQETLGSIPGWGRSPGEGNGNLLQYFAWRVPWTEEPGGLQSMGSQRVGHNWSDSTHTLAYQWYYECISLYCLY